MFSSDTIALVHLEKLPALRRNSEENPRARRALLPSGPFHFLPRSNDLLLSYRLFQRFELFLDKRAIRDATECVPLEIESTPRKKTIKIKGRRRRTRLSYPLELEESFISVDEGDISVQARCIRRTDARRRQFVSLAFNADEPLDASTLLDSKNSAVSRVTRRFRFNGSAQPTFLFLRSRETDAARVRYAFRETSSIDYICLLYFFVLFGFFCIHRKYTINYFRLTTVIRNTPDTNAVTTISEANPPVLYLHPLSFSFLILFRTVTGPI